MGHGLTHRRVRLCQAMERLTAPPLSSQSQVRVLARGQVPEPVPQLAPP